LQETETGHKIVFSESRRTSIKARLFKEIYERIPRYLLFMAIYLSFFLLLEMGKAHIN
jgi:hypothetical protein